MTNHPGAAFGVPADPGDVLAALAAEEAACQHCDAEASLHTPVPDDPHVVVVHITHDPSCPELLAMQGRSRRGRRRR